jgi:hypothetical protein
VKTWNKKKLQNLMLGGIYKPAPIQFKAFAKIPRLNRRIVITEKIDGTNGCVIVTEDGRVAAASRSRLLTLQNDHFDFAKWVEENKDELLNLGAGYHYGEWWGQGINRGYGSYNRNFSLFNVNRWSDSDVRPSCCKVVPVLYDGLFSFDDEFDHRHVRGAMYWLKAGGSQAMKGFMDPEGIMVYHVAAGQYFKVTYDNDAEPKG